MMQQKNYFLGYCVKKEKSQRITDDGTSAGDLHKKGKCVFCSHVWDLCWYGLEGMGQKMDNYKQQRENHQKKLKPVTGVCGACAVPTPDFYFYFHIYVFMYFIFMYFFFLRVYIF